ncbi:ATP-binding cassette sub-family F member 3-like [Pollicipes pollicipes]|uniref:ATP-binding cassette sub-family F member 3-like n=1 Tax=Pollicipes pollicipes TaxID=41117 RepID=UPI0018856F00|nr:ATP-binding cassette sub-family F member 3-like [Pollicipes pollicipes]
MSDGQLPPVCPCWGASIIGRTMAARIVRDAFPHMDEDLFQYVEGVLDSGEEFESGDDVYEAIGGIVEQVAGDDSEHVVSPAL